MITLTQLYLKAVQPQSDRPDPDLSCQTNLQGLKQDASVKRLLLSPLKPLMSFLSLSKLH